VAVLCSASDHVYNCDDADLVGLWFICCCLQPRKRYVFMYKSSRLIAFFFQETNKITHKHVHIQKKKNSPKAIHCCMFHSYTFASCVHKRRPPSGTSPTPKLPLVDSRCRLRRRRRRQWPGSRRWHGGRSSGGRTSGRRGGDRWRRTRAPFLVIDDGKLACWKLVNIALHRRVHAEVGKSSSNHA